MRIFSGFPDVRASLMVLRAFGFCIIAMLASTDTSRAFNNEAGIESQIIDVLKMTWESLDNIEIQGEEFVGDGNGNQDNRPNLATQNFDIIVGSGGRMAYKQTNVAPSGQQTVLANFRQDGRRTYTIKPFEDDPESIKVLEIEAQRSTHDHYLGPMVIAMNLWMPTGRPLHAFLENGGKLESLHTENGQESFVITGGFGQDALRIELDREHGWLAKRITLAKSLEIVATRFERDNGMWFPVEGYMTHIGAPNGVSSQTGFRVTSLRINRPLDSSVFDVPSLPPGTLIKDETGGRSGPRGGEEAWKQLAAKHPGDTMAKAAIEAKAPYQPQPLSSNAYRNWLALLLAGGAVSLIIAAVVLKIRSH